MTQLPGTGYLSDAARTEAEMKTALEQVHDVIAEIGSKAPETLTISSDSITAPLSSVVLVDAEGSGADDILTTIVTTGITQGRVVVLRNASTASSEAASSAKVTINSGTSANNLELTGGGSLILCAQRMIAFVYLGDHWVEVWRSYGRKNAEDSAAERLDAGLGTSAVEDIATSSGASANSTVLKVGASANIATDSILAIDASGNIKAGSVTGGNADTLDSLDSTAFVRTTSGVAQSIDANLTSVSAGAARINANTTTAGQSSGYTLQASGTERGSLYLDTSNGEVELRTQTAGATATDSIKLDPGGLGLAYNVAPGVSSWESLRPGAGNGLDADTLDGSHLSEVLDAAASSYRWAIPADITTDEAVNRDDTGGGPIVGAWTFPSSVQALAGTYCRSLVLMLCVRGEIRSTWHSYTSAVGPPHLVPDYVFTGHIGSGITASGGTEFVVRDSSTGSSSNFDLAPRCHQVAEVATGTSNEYDFYFKLTFGEDFILPASFDSFRLHAHRYNQGSATNGDFEIKATSAGAVAQLGQTPVSEFIFDISRPIT